MGSSLDALRNIGIVAHINAGKTTLSERILYDTGKQPFMGEVDHGTATMDWMAEEQDRGISITAAVTTVDWRGFRINLVDTPGHVDFTVEVERSLRVLDGVVVLLDGVRGVESQTETVWHHADRFELPRLVFVNKLDRDAADFDRSIESLTERFGCRAVPVLVPFHAGDGAAVGLVDAVDGSVGQWAGSEQPDPAQLAARRAVVVEACADVDETILADVVEDRPVAVERLWAALRRGVLERRLVPVLGGTALHNHGVQRLLDAVCRYLPSPRDRGRAGGDGGDAFAGLLFKMAADDDGTFGYVRVEHGRLRRGDRVEAASTGVEFEVEELARMHAMRRDDVDEAGPGEIVGLRLPRPLPTGDTLRAPGSKVQLETRPFSRPVLTVAIEPRRSDALDALRAAAERIALEDPTLVVRSDAASGALQVSGMGELHLDVFRSRLDRVLDDPVRFGRPLVACVETVEVAGDAAVTCRAQDRPSERWVRAHVSVRPTAGEVGALWAGDATAPERDAVLAELHALLASGIHGAYPASDVTLVAESVERAAGVDADDPLVLEAVDLATRRACVAAGPLVLEPVMRFVVRCPTESSSSVLADLRSRGADVDLVEPSFGSVEVRGVVRLRAALDYATQLRSMTRGKGAAEFRLDRFAPQDGAKNGGRALDRGHRDQ